MPAARIGLIGDRDPTVTAHRAIPLALARSFDAIGAELEPVWLPTAELARDPALATGFEGLWCVPATPYASGEAAIAAIRWARESGTPFLGTCGTAELEESYHCRFGLDPRHRSRFEGSALRIVGEDPAGEARAFELDGHPFFFGTAFQPERAALEGRAHPIVTTFVRAVLESRAATPRA